jgi:hypothetical protein
LNNIIILLLYDKINVHELAGTRLDAQEIGRPGDGLIAQLDVQGIPSRPQSHIAHLQRQEEMMREKRGGDE